MAQPEPPPVTPPMNGSLPGATPLDTPRDEDKVMLVLAYLGILALIPYLVSKEAFVKWHAKQGLTLCAAFIVFNIAGGIIGYVPVIGWLIGLLLMPLVSIGGLIVIIVAIIRALKGERWRIPVIADLADKW